MAVINFYHVGLTVPENAVYIGRRMAKFGLEGSKFANPFKITDAEPREVVIAKYRAWLWEQIRGGKITIEDLLEMEGKDLLCFCHPKPCHGDVIEAAVQWARSVENKRRANV